MKSYVLKKIDYLGLEVKRVDYTFQIRKAVDPTKFIRIIVHHTGAKQRTLQNIIDLHVEKNKWAAIGYHFMIGKNGQIYYTRDLKYSGAHTYHFNRNSIGIALFGNFDENTPSEKQLESLRKLIDALFNKFDIKEILGHNEAIYRYLKGKYYWIKGLPGTNPLDIETKLSHELFLREITTKVLEKDAGEDTVKTIKRLKTCPGFNMYKPLKEIRKNFV